MVLRQRPGMALKQRWYGIETDLVGYGYKVSRLIGNQETSIAKHLDTFKRKGSHCYICTAMSVHDGNLKCTNWKSW